jgi:hypothetical protein
METPIIVTLWAVAIIATFIAARAFVLLLETTWRTFLDLRKVSAWKAAWEDAQPPKKKHPPVDQEEYLDDDD